MLAFLGVNSISLVLLTSITIFLLVWQVGSALSSWVKVPWTLISSSPWTEGRERGGTGSSSGSSSAQEFRRALYRHFWDHSSQNYDLPATARTRC